MRLCLVSASFRDLYGILLHLLEKSNPQFILFIERYIYAFDIQYYMSYLFTITNVIKKYLKWLYNMKKYFLKCVFKKYMFKSVQINKYSTKLLIFIYVIIQFLKMYVSSVANI